MAQPLQNTAAMRAFLPIVALAALALLAGSCTSTDDTKMTKIAEITVAAYLTPCATYEILDCMVVDDGSGRPDINNSIDGFTYHWGSTYRLDVEIAKIRNPPPDGESREVRLRTIIDVQPVAARSTFTLALHGVSSVNSPPLLATNGQGFAMASGRQIVCDDPAVCTAIADALHQPTPFDLTLRHPDDPANEAAPLIAVAVAPR
jgi:hypothetical protein